MNTYAIWEGSPENAFDSDITRWIEAETPEAAVAAFRAADPDTCGTITAQQIRPADYMGAVARSVVDWLEDACNEDEMLANPDWFGPWEDGALDLTPVARAALTAKINAALNEFAAEYPDCFETFACPVDLPTTHSAVTTEGGDDA